MLPSFDQTPPDTSWAEYAEKVLQDYTAKRATANALIGLIIGTPDSECFAKIPAERMSPGCVAIGPHKNSGVTRAGGLKSGVLCPAPACQGLIAVQRVSVNGGPCSLMMTLSRA